MHTNVLVTGRTCYVSPYYQIGDAIQGIRHFIRSLTFHKKGIGVWEIKEVISFTAFYHNISCMLSVNSPIMYAFCIVVIEHRIILIKTQFFYSVI